MEVQPPVPDPSDGGHAGFDLRVTGTRVELCVHPPKGEAMAPTAAEIFAALADMPLDNYPAERVVEALRRPDGRAILVAEVVPLSQETEWELKVSPSRMAAYLIPSAALCPVEPEAPPPQPIEGDALRKALTAAGITRGLIEEVLAAFAPSATCEAVTLVARGAPATAGVDARIEYLFNLSPVLTPVTRADGSVDYHAASIHASIDADTELARRYEGVPGEPGYDVFGNTVNLPPPADRPLAALVGKGTEVKGDTLFAARPGRPVIEAGKIEILPIYEVKGDVDYAVGNIEFNGDVIVVGDVHPGFFIKAEGTVTVRGIVEHANISAGHDLQVGGILGDGTTVIQVGGSMRAQYIHSAIVTVGTVLVVNHEIVASTVTAAKVQTSPNGRIVGGEITAREEIAVGSLGSQQGVPTRLTVVIGTEKCPAVVRAAKLVHAGIDMTIGHRTLRVIDDLPAASFWNHEGEITLLPPASAPPKVA